MMPHRLKRLQTVAHILNVTRKIKLVNAAKAETALRQLTQLSDRTQAIADGYAGDHDTRCAKQLADRFSFASSLQTLVVQLARDVGQSQQVADDRAGEVRNAERNHDAAIDRARCLQIALAKTNLLEGSDLAPRKRIGTIVE